MISGFIQSREAAQSSSTTTAKKEMDCSPQWVNGQSTVESLLGDWRDGGDGQGFWTFGADRTKLFAVSDYKLLKSGVSDAPEMSVNDPDAAMLPVELRPTGKTFVYIYRVHSSTQGGLPITKDWAFNVVATQKYCLVRSVQEWN
jgi:hypothetical protein